MAALEAFGTASLGGGPGRHDSSHCPAAHLEAISTGIGSVSLESKTRGSCAHTVPWVQAAGGRSRLLATVRKRHLDVDYAYSYRCVPWRAGEGERRPCLVSSLLSSKNANHFHLAWVLPLGAEMTW